jgi:uncharacterized repeat protein (TIGR01451 family)
MRRRTRLAALVAALVTLALLPGPAALAATHPTPQPPTVVGGHGATGSTVAYLPGSSSCYAIAQTNVHFGYNGPVDADADAIRGAGAVRHGPCVVRTAIIEFRIGFANGQTFRDLRPSKSSSNSNNGLVPADTLNSAGDFSPDVTFMPAWSDWVRVTCTDPQVRVRMVFQVRFSNGALVNYSIASQWVSHDLDGCQPPPPATADLQVTKFALDETTAKTEYTVPGDDFTYQVDVANLGPNPATGIVLIEQWPVGVDPPNAGDLTTNGCIYDATTRQIRCPLGNLDPDFIFHIAIRTSTNNQAGDTLVNTASVTSATPDPVAGNNSDTLTLTRAA